MASTAMRMWTTSDVEVPDALGVRLDELLAWLDVRSHQLLKRVVDGGDVVDGDLQQHARLRVHGRDPVIAHLFDVEVVADSRTHGGDQVANLVRREHLVEARLLDVEDLAAQWKDRLRAAIAAALRRAPRGVTLDDVELGQRRV